MPYSDPEKNKAYQKTYQKKWYEDNKERLKAVRKKNYEENKERHLELGRIWKKNNIEKRRKQRRERYLANRESELLSHKIYKANNRHLGAEQSARRRATKKQATPSWLDIEEVKYIYKVAKDNDLVVDHIVPLTSKLVCGLHVQDNLRCISAEMNTRKSNLYWADM